MPAQMETLDIYEHVMEGMYFKKVSWRSHGMLASNLASCGILVQCGSFAPKETRKLCLPPWYLLTLETRFAPFKVRRLSCDDFDAIRTVLIQR